MCGGGGGGEEVSLICETDDRFAVCNFWKGSNYYHVHTSVHANHDIATLVLEYIVWHLRNFSKLI